MANKWVSRLFDAFSRFETRDLRVRQSDDSCTARIAMPVGQSSDTVMTLPAASGTLVTSDDQTTAIAAAVASYVPAASTQLFTLARVGAEAGWTVSGFDAVIASLGSNAAASTCVYGISPLRVGASIVSFAVNGKLTVSSGSDPFTLDAVLYRMPSTGVPVSLGAITQVALTATAAFTPSKTLTSPHTVLADNSYFVLVTATTGGNEIVILSNVSVTTA